MYIARKPTFFTKTKLLLQTACNINSRRSSVISYTPLAQTVSVGMVKPTAFGPLTHCKSYTFIIIHRDATTLSCSFPKLTGVFLPDLHCEQQNCKQGAKKKPARLSSPPLWLPVFWFNHSSQSWGYSVDLCAERAQRLGKLSHGLQTTQMKTF